jgi:hypothetical protein
VCNLYLRELVQGLMVIYFCKYAFHWESFRVAVGAVCDGIFSQ